MKTLYLDCSMGAAGDMLTAALLELMPDPGAFLAHLNALGVPGVKYSAARAVRCGIAGTRVTVTVNGVAEGEEPPAHAHEHGHEHEHGYEHGHTHEHGHMHEHEHTHEHEHEHEHEHADMEAIARVVAGLALPERVREDVLAVYALLAEAESRAHGVPVGQIHFHEVGAMDAVADIAAVCLLMTELAPDEVVVSPVRVGGGQVRCAHGLLPVPAPATAYLLRDIPIYGGGIQAELCTPTGAALLRRFATRFGDLPPMRPRAVGYGMGARDFEAANCVRAMLGEREGATDAVLELSCNVDDMTAEALGFAMERLFEGGAREVYTIPIGMKKSRPGTLLRVVCAPQDREAMLELIFRHTSTLGVRETATRRYVLSREIETLATPYGPVRRKRASGYGAAREKLEYDDLARVARERGISLGEAEALIEAWLSSPAPGDGKARGKL